jgi:metallo-beta-lactamase family protein
MGEKKLNSDDKIKLHFYGGAESVTGSNFVIEYGDKKIMVDCGLTQGAHYRDPEDDPNRKPFKYNPSEIDYLLVTHAHADHIGRIPKLVKDGFRGEIYSTPSTRDLTEVMFDDALSVISNYAREHNIEPTYHKEHVELALALWKTIPYHEEKDLTDRFNVYFKDAGHILGSAIVYLKDKIENKNIVFTGDLGNTPTPLIRDTEKVDDADFLIMESVYGDRNHEGRAERKEKLKITMNRIIQRKGTLLIPVFSLEKTQVLLHEMNDLIEGGEVPSVPVFFDSPLGIRLTDVYANQFQNFNEKVQERIKGGDDIFDFPKLKKTYDRKESMEIHRTRGPKIIIASSGMSIGGRIMDHEKRYLSDPKNAILFIGYQVPGTLGRAIKEGNKTVKIDKKKVYIKAEIDVVNGYSSHKDSDNLLNFALDNEGRVEKVFVVLGESKSAMYLTQKIRDNSTIDAVHPNDGETVILY